MSCEIEDKMLQVESRGLRGEQPARFDMIRCIRNGTGQLIGARVYGGLTLVVNRSTAVSYMLARD